MLMAAIGFLPIIMRRPWVVEAMTERSEVRMQWAVVGWRRSGQAIEEVAESLSLGHRRIEPEGAQQIEPA